MIEVLERRISEDCGCLEEDIVCHDYFITIHHEPDKTGHVIFDFGECGEMDFFTGECETMEDLEKEAEKIAFYMTQQPTKGRRA